MTEQEEKELRDKLDKEVEDGCYIIGEEPWLAMTGKGGYINWLIALEKSKFIDIECQ